MNERFEKLVEQAGLQPIVRGDHIVFDISTKENLKELAELIVKECVDILMKPEYAMKHPEELSKYNEGWVNGRLSGIEHIKEHFGVE